MARITVEDCLDQIPNRFHVVISAAKRARVIAMGAEPWVQDMGDKPTVLALREIAEGKIDPATLANIRADDFGSGQ